VALTYAVRKGYRLIRAVEKILESVEQHGTMLEEIRKEVRPNGGGSLKDAVNRIDSRVRTLEAALPLHMRGSLEPSPDHS
jgi:hypothetical protein